MPTSNHKHKKTGQTMYKYSYNHSIKIGPYRTAHVTHTINIHPNRPGISFIYTHYTVNMDKPPTP